MNCEEVQRISDSDTSDICRVKEMTSLMNFKQRLSRYLLGLGIGCVVVFMMFPNHDWLGWTPGKTVMKQIREINFVIDPVAQCQMDCIGINKDQIQLARKDGHIDFDKSAVQTVPLIYHLEYGNLAMKVQLEDKLATLKEVSAPASECNCN
jgi:hypothetical protein